MNQGLGGRVPEKLAILAEAWSRWKDYIGGGDVFEDADLEAGGILHLTYTTLTPEGKKLPTGQVRLINVADFYGIDWPEMTKKVKDQPPEPPPPTPDEMKRMYEANDERRRKANSAK